MSQPEPTPATPASDPGQYYLSLAAAFCRGSLGLPRDTPDEDALALGLAAGLRLHKFKRRDRQLPRVHHVLGVLQGIWPQTLVDIGSGRGTFLTSSIT